jgi:hypothetical protein
MRISPLAKRIERLRLRNTATARLEDTMAHSKPNGAGGAETTMPSPNQPDLASRSDIVLDAARVLYVNGQTTDATLAAANQLAGTLGLRSTIVPRWGELLSRRMPAGRG